MFNQILCEQFSVAWKMLTHGNHECLPTFLTRPWARSPVSSLESSLWRSVSMVRFSPSASTVPAWKTKLVILNTRRRYKVIAEQYCKISPLICMVCLFFNLLFSKASFTKIEGMMK